MGKTKKYDDVKRINANIPMKLFERIQAYANDNMLDLTSAYIVLLNDALNSYTIKKAMPMYVKLLQDTKLLKMIDPNQTIDNDNLERANDILSKLTPEQLQALAYDDNDTSSN